MFMMFMPKWKFNIHLQGTNIKLKLVAKEKHIPKQFEKGHEFFRARAG